MRVLPFMGPMPVLTKMVAGCLDEKAPELVHPFPSLAILENVPVHVSARTLVAHHALEAAWPGRPSSTLDIDQQRDASRTRPTPCQCQLSSRRLCGAQPSDRPFTCIHYSSTQPYSKDRTTILIAASLLVSTPTIFCSSPVLQRLGLQLPVGNRDVTNSQPEAGYLLPLSPRQAQTQELDDANASFQAAEPCPKGIQ